MALTPEEQRALEWQAQQKRRAAFQRFLQAKLKAPEEPARTIRQNFEPLRRQ